jgi:hypothetical protein
MLKKSSSMIDYFIVCHDQDLIIKLIEDQRFSHLPNAKFLFVATNPTTS